MDDVLKVIGAILVADCCVTTLVILLTVLFVKPLRPPSMKSPSGDGIKPRSGGSR